MYHAVLSIVIYEFLKIKAEPLKVSFLIGIHRSPAHMGDRWWRIPHKHYAQMNICGMCSNRKCSWL